MSGHYKLDGSPYEGPWEEQLFAWARDFEDFRGRVVEQTTLWNGLWVSTVWTGVAALSYSPEPLIFETMVFDLLHPEEEAECGEKYATLSDAALGHRFFIEEYSRVLPTLRRWFLAGFAKTDRYDWSEYGEAD